MRHYNKIISNVKRATQNLETEIHRTETELEEKRQTLEQLDTEVGLRYEALKCKRNKVNEIVSDAEQNILQSCKNHILRIQDNAIQKQRDRPHQMAEILKDLEPLLVLPPLNEAMERRFNVLKEELKSGLMLSSSYLGGINSLMGDVNILCKANVDAMKVENIKFNEQIDIIDQRFRTLQKRIRENLNDAYFGNFLFSKVRPALIPNLSLYERLTHVVHRVTSYMFFVDKIVSYIPPVARSKQRASDAYAQWETDSVAKIERLKNIKNFLEIDREERFEFTEPIRKVILSTTSM